MPCSHDEGRACAEEGRAVAAIGWRHGLASLVTAPGWLLLACAAAIAAAIAPARPRMSAVFAFCAGAALGLTVPRDVAAPSTRLVTHAPGFARGVDLFDALQRLDDDPQSIGGAQIAVSGLWRARSLHAPAAVYRPVMACCIADAVDVGFDVMPASRGDFPDGVEIGRA